MEFRSIAPNDGVQIQLSRHDRMGILRRRVESALELADDLDLPMAGIHLDQALQNIVEASA